MENNNLTCPGCNATFKHASSLSTHKNGNAKKNLKPCLEFYKKIGKEYEEKWASRTLTNKDYDLVHALSLKILKWIKESEDVKDDAPAYDLQAFGDQFPPPHVSVEYIIDRFIKRKREDFLGGVFSKAYLDPVNGANHCVIRIPKVTHETMCEVYNGSHWKHMKLHDVIFDFMLNIDKVLQAYKDDHEDDQEFDSRYTRFEAWFPDTEDDIKKKVKVTTCEDGIERKYGYTALVNLIKGHLLGDTRDVITQIKKDHEKSKKK